MTSLKRKQSGFTIIELLIVIIVIGILATLVITTFSGIQKNARNRTREADINALHSQLEYYYGQNGTYPTLTDLNDATWRSTNLKGLDAEALKDPQGADETLVGSPTAKTYSYAVSPTGCNNTSTDCTGYVLTATREGEDPYVKNSLN
jgi:prepilin-type N-terminal cleavage/methylation domain-containing protein